MYTLEELKAARARKLQPSNAPIASSNAEFSIEALKAARARKMQALEAAQQPSGFMDRLAQVGHGAATGTANTLDTIARFAVAGTDIENPELSQEAQEHFKENHAGQAEKYVSNKINKAYGKDLKGKDSLGKALNFGGEMLSLDPFRAGAAKTAVKAGIVPALKYLGRRGAEALGAGAAVHLTPKMAKEGSALGAAEDIGKAMLGTSAGPRIGKGLIGAAKAVWSPGQAAKKAAEGALKWGLNAGVKPKVDSKLFETAAKHNVNLPFNVGVNNPRADWLANTGLNRNVFTSEKYNQSIEGSRQSVNNAVNRIVDQISPHKLSPHEASGDFYEALKKNNKSVKNEISSLYDASREHLSKKDKVIPRSTKEFIDELKPTLATDIGLKSKKGVSQVFRKLERRWGLNNRPVIKTGEEAVLDALKAKPKGEMINNRLVKPVKLEKLVAAYQDLGKKVNYDKNITGHEALLNGLKSKIRDDIGKSTNAAFLDSLDKANSYMAKQVGDRGLRTPQAKKLMHDTFPSSASSYMGSPQKIADLTRIAGDSPDMVKAVNSLKRAKVEEIFSQALTPEGFNAGAFSRVFAKSENRQLMKSLVTPKVYSQLGDIRRIAAEIQRSGRSMFNTSGTGVASSNLGTLHKGASEANQAVWGVMKVLAGAGGAAAVTNPLTALAVTAGGASIPYTASRLLANPEFVSSFRQYSLARQQGQAKRAATLLERLMNLGQPAYEAAITQLKTSKESKE